MIRSGESNSSIFASVVKGINQLWYCLGTKSITLLGTINHNPGYAIGFVVQNILVGFGSLAINRPINNGHGAVL
jgi:hypothetical protein